MTNLLASTTSLCRAAPAARLALADAEQAARLAQIGLLNRVVPADQLESEALRVAQAIARQGRVAVSVIKEAALTLTHLPLDEAFHREAALGQRAFTCDEAREGLRRFLSRKAS